MILQAPIPGGLLAMLAEIPDPRGRQGRRHPMAAMLAAVICGLLSGATGCAAISQWVRTQETRVWHWLGFKRKPPSENCFRILLARLPTDTLETVISSWISQLLSSREANSTNGLSAIAVDGKTLCGTLQQHGQSIHLLSLLDHATAGVLRQLAMPPTTNEHKAAMLLPKQIALDGRVVTGDAMFCQRDLCQQIIDDGGDYLLTVKDNQPELKRAIADDFQPGCSPLQRA